MGGLNWVSHQPTRSTTAPTAPRPHRANAPGRHNRYRRERESGEPAAAPTSNSHRACDSDSRRPGLAASHRLRATCIHGSAVRLKRRRPVDRPARSAVKHKRHSTTTAFRDIATPARHKPAAAPNLQFARGHDSLLCRSAESTSVRLRPTCHSAPRRSSPTRLTRSRVWPARVTTSHRRPQAASPTLARTSDTSPCEAPGPGRRQGQPSISTGLTIQLLVDLPRKRRPACGRPNRRSPPGTTQALAPLSPKLSISPVPTRAAMRIPGA